GDRDGGMQRLPERDVRLGAPVARMTDTDGPCIDHLVEVLGRAVGKRLRPLAAELVQAPALAMPLITELLREAACIEVRPTRAVLVHGAAIGELRTALGVQLGE